MASPSPPPHANTTDRKTNPAKLRVFFIPFFATGHLIPMTDLAVLFAGNPRVEATIVVTPSNAALISATISRSSNPIRLLTYPFPSVGLPAGIENLATASPSESHLIYAAVDLAHQSHEALLRRHLPDALVADIPFFWAAAIADELGIPRLTFHAVGVFPQLIMNNLFRIRSEIANSGSDNTVVTVPGLPGKQIRIPRRELPQFLVSEDHMSESWARMKEAQLRAHGVVVNTFCGLEPEYCEMYRKVDAKRAYFVGPVALSLYGSDPKGGGLRGCNSGSHVDCLTWLDRWEVGSVVFVCFGSWCHFSPKQLAELALGLEESGRPFLWAVRGDRASAAEEWIPEGWEERVKAKGMVIWGWAPQVAILGHTAVGAFMTHCGWNSVLEAASSGVGMLTWPLVFEQFINERLVVEVTRSGARVWEGGRRSEREEDSELVSREVIRRAISRFMETGGEGEKAREKAKELARMAKEAVEEGGTSRRNLDHLIEDLINARGHV
ncbi:probable UDP-glucosyl transferase 73B6 [Typha angustifolia]|uniref:probable UDP-glucosyl transferase 73B6 n=1 Tax=Typha angustifolia TaxID=59011 RepID=UPI003C2F44FA